MTSQNHRVPCNQPGRLSGEDKANLLSIIHDFFENRTLYEIKKTLWEMVETALIADYTRYDKADQRHHLLWFYRELETMVEASQLLYQKDVQK